MTQAAAAAGASAAAGLGCESSPIEARARSEYNNEMRQCLSGGVKLRREQCVFAWMARICGLTAPGSLVAHRSLTVCTLTIPANPPAAITCGNTTFGLMDALVSGVEASLARRLGSAGLEYMGD